MMIPSSFNSAQSCCTSGEPTKGEHVDSQLLSGSENAHHTVHLGKVDRISFLEEHNSIAFDGQERIMDESKTIVSRQCNNNNTAS